MKRLSISFAIAGVCFGILSFAPLPSLAYTTTTVSANITSDTTWRPDYIYVISSAITINSGARLTITPGTIVKFNGVNASLTVAGFLDAEGDSTSSIYFTSYKDDSAGGDTNGDTTSTQPAAGNWSGIKTNLGASTTITYAIIRYGGYSTGMLYNSGGFLTVLHSEMATGSFYMVNNVSGTSITLSNVQHTNSYALYLTRGSLTFHDNYFGDVGNIAYINLTNDVSFSHTGNSSSGKRNGVWLAGSPARSQTYVNGVLAIELPKRAELKPKQVKVNVAKTLKAA